MMLRMCCSHREAALTAEVAAAMGRAAKGAPSKAAAAAASTAAFEDNLDLVLALGWAHVVSCSRHTACFGSSAFRFGSSAQDACQAPSLVVGHRLQAAVHLSPDEHRRNIKRPDRINSGSGFAGRLH